MKLTALAADKVGPRLGFTCDSVGLPSHRSVAVAVRNILRRNGSASVCDVQNWVARISAPHLVPGDALGVRISAVLTIMRRSGELLSVDRPEGTVVWSRPSGSVRLAPDRCLLLGTTDLADAEEADEGPLRYAADAASPATLMATIGPPAFRTLAQGVVVHPMTSLSGFSLRLAELVGLEGMPLSPADFDPEWPVKSSMPFLARLKASGERVIAVDGVAGAQGIALPPGELGCWIWLASQWPTATIIEGDGPGLPVQLRSLLAMGATPLDDRLMSWVVPDWFAETIGAWLGEQPVESVGDDVRSASDQREIIELPAEARIVVEAGPGSGKTRVACARVASLISGGASPTRVWAVSFTKAAVGELRDRISGFMEHPDDAADVRISTLDSLAAQFRRYDDTPSASGETFDDGIRTSLGMILEDDRQLLGFLRTLEHVVLDEVQDLTANRNNLVFELIQRLPATCGVTLFQDSAQAIYGFSAEGGATLPALSKRVLATDLGFRKFSLVYDHRSQEPALKGLKADLRRMLLADDGCSGEDVYSSVRSALEAFAAPDRRAIEEQLPSNSSMILFRSNVELVAEATRLWDAGHVFRVRLANREPTIQPWVGAILRLAARDGLSSDIFAAHWSELWPRPTGLAHTEAWRRLQAVTGSRQVELSGLAERLRTGSPPLIVTQPVLGRRGALLSTIHGVKGREAEHVTLVLPKAREQTGDASYLEEARVLFVGATRPRSTLRLATATGVISRLGGGRAWTAWKSEHARIEIGVDGDVDEVCTVHGGPGETAEAVTARQIRLWAAADRIVRLKAVLSSEGEYELLEDAGSDLFASYGFLSRKFRQSLGAIGNSLHPHGAFPSSTIRGFYCIGARTAVLSGNDPDISPFGLVPVLAGFAPLFLNRSRKDQLAKTMSDI